MSPTRSAARGSPAWRSRHAQLRHVAPADKRVALVFSAYPTKHARIGNAVGLDTPASAVALLRAMRERGYQVGRAARCRGATTATR